ncbi:MAG: type IV secretion system protein [Wolbachia endosymbiont of Menacanthus eurysternus]|nr:MAG: type IV secretion system protein [Wolbachia endosymbiont of Menacanthus eurysternus]
MFFILSSCEHHCVKPENLNLHEKSDVVSTEQKWVDSGIHISDTIKIVEINILPNKADLYSKQYEDFTIQPGKNSFILSKFSLRIGDKISFSIVGNKICKKINDIKKIRYIKIDEKCEDEEDQYFAHILNQSECQEIWQNEEYKYTICPNKLTIGNTKWISGQEYWNSTFLKHNKKEIKKEIENIISTMQKENISCNKLLNNQKSKIDTHILNFACQNTCYYHGRDCVEIESNTIDNGNIAKNFGNTLIYSKDRISEIIRFAEEIKKREIKTYIPSLMVSMKGEKFEYGKESIRTNYDYEIKNNHSQGEKLTFILTCKKQCNGGYNVRVTKTLNSTDSKNSLYIHISNTFPNHDPDESQGDISINTNKIHDTEYMKNLKEKLKNKKGTVYYRIMKDNGYNENKSQFNIRLITEEPRIKTFSIIYDFFDKRIKTIFFGSNNINSIHSELSVTQSIYQNLISSNRTKTIRSTIISLLVLYIILYALYYFFGLTHVSIYEFSIICIKIGVITQLLQDNSWNLFYNNAFSIFIETLKQLINTVNFKNTTSNVFEFLDLPLSRLLSLHSILLTISLIFSGYLGIISFCLVIWGLLTITLSIFNVLFSFITSIVIVALLLSLTPIFIICLLFAYTRQLFYNWIKNLARFTIHPIILLVFVSLVGQTLDYIIYSIFNFEVCTTCILNVDLKIFEFCILYGYISKYTPNITTIIIFVILGHIMKALVEASSKISDSLFNSYTHNEPGKQYQQNLMSLIGIDKQSIYRRKQARKINISQLLDVSNKKLELPRSLPLSTKMNRRI